MTLSFEEWLLAQQNREDLIGNLARSPSMREVNHKSSRRKRDEHKVWADIVIAIAGPVYIAVFNEAWQEFLQAKQAATNPPG